MSEPIKSRFWSLRFETDDGSTHPVRLEYAQPVTEDRPRHYAQGYLKAKKDWLKSIQDVSPRDEQAAS